MMIKCFPDYCTTGGQRKTQLRGRTSPSEKCIINFLISISFNLHGTSPSGGGRVIVLFTNFLDSDEMEF